MAVQALPSSRRTSPPALVWRRGRAHAGSRRFLDWRLSRVVAYVEANLAEPISLADLAVVAGMSRMYFASQFRAATGLKPHDYVLRKRIERAQHLLSCTSEALVEVALGRRLPDPGPFHHGLQEAGRRHAASLASSAAPAPRGEAAHRARQDHV